mgnify:CR=1 FL=1
MTNYTRQREKRLARISKITKSLSKIADLEVQARARECDAQDARLETIKSYLGEYVGSLKIKEERAVDLAILKTLRQFSWWLTELSVDQEQQLDQAKSILELVKADAQERRVLAKAVEKASSDVAQAIHAQVERGAQKELDELASVRWRRLA